MATNEQSVGIFDMTVPAVMVFPALLQPKAYQENGKDKGEPKYGGTFLFAAEHPDLKALKAACLAVARAMWPGVDAKSIGWPFSSGAAYAAKRGAAGKDGTLFADKAMLKARSKYEPMLSWIESGKVKEVPSTASGAVASAKFFSGAEVLATFNFRAAEVSGNKYVTAYLNKVFSTGKGTRIGGGRSAADAFKAYIGHATETDPTAGADLDDEMPF